MKLENLFDDVLSNFKLINFFKIMKTCTNPIVDLSKTSHLVKSMNTFQTVVPFLSFAQSKLGGVSMGMHVMASHDMTISHEK